MNKFRFIVLYFFIWRLFLFLPLLLGELFVKYRTGYEYTNIIKFGGAFFPVSHFLLYPWANFDGLHYLFIAGRGYTNNFGFFPLYPLLIHAVSFLFGIGKPFSSIQFFSGFFIANISFLGSLIVFYKLLRLDYSIRQSRTILIFLLLFPTSFFFASLYSESLFLLLTLLSFYCSRNKNWVLAGIFASCSTLTRIIGIFLLPALLYEFFIEQKKKTLSLLVPLFLPVISLFAYCYYNFIKTGDWLYFIHAQGNFGNNRTVNSIVLFPQTVFRYIKILATVNPILFEFWISFLELSAFFFCSFLLYIAWKKKVRVSYLIFAVLSFLLPISTGTFTALPRYVLVLFPMFIALGLIEQKWIHRTYIILSTVILFLLLMLFSKGYFVA